MTGCRMEVCRTMLKPLPFVLLALGLGGCNAVIPGGSGNDDGTQFSETGCGSSYTDQAYDYGFDLPTDATLVRTKNETSSLTNSLWTITESKALINIKTRVEGASADADLGTVVSFSNDLAVLGGADLLAEEEVVLGDGDAGIQTTLRFDGLTTFRVQALANSRLYSVEAVIQEADRTAETDQLLSDIVLSLCVGD